MKKQNVIVATGLPKLNKAFFGSEKVSQRFNVVDVVDLKEKLIPSIDKHPEVDIILVSDGLPGKGSLVQTMIDVRIQKQKRVVYLTAAPKKTNYDVVMNRLGMLVRVGIYDIISETPIAPGRLLKKMVKPSKREDADVKNILDYMDELEEVSAPQQSVSIVESKSDEVKKSSGLIDNLYLISSIKPGTGKSFTSVNLASMIAKYGRKKENGERPRVALIDADLQTLSIGTLIQIEDPKKNIKTAFEKIQTVLDDKGREVDNPALVADARNFVKQCFQPYTHAKNLEALVGSNLHVDEVGNVRDVDYTWLLNTIKDDYDVIIVDSNSSLFHVSTTPMMLFSKEMYYVVNLDFNNIRNNSRYQRELKEIGVFDKLKYILNENVTKEEVEKQGWSEELLFDEDALKSNQFNLAGSIPVIEKTTFLNRIYEGIPIALDDKEHTLDARISIGEIANQIWEIDKLEYMKQQKEKVEERNKPKKKGLFGKR